MIVPKLGDIRVDRLTRKQIDDWQHALAKSPPRLRTKAGAKQRYRDVDLRDPKVRRQRQASG